MEMERSLESAYKFGAGRYHQSHGAAALAGEEARRLGRKKACLLAGPTAFAIAGDRVLNALKQAEIESHVLLYHGQCCAEQAHIFAQELRSSGCDLVIGIGGGRILDLSKVTARIANVPIMTVPTISATSACFTHMCVMYTPDGHWVGTWYLPEEISAVLADMDYLAAQPRRYLASGAMDAMAKWVEICHPRPEEKQRLGGDTLMARVIAKQVFDRLALLTPRVFAGMENHGNEDEKIALMATRIQRESAETFCPQPQMEEADLWEVCFLSMAGAAMVSGTARCLQQSALAHAIYEWTRRFRPEEVRNAFHGEIVGVGMRAQTLFNGDQETIRVLEETLRALQMPRMLEDLGISNGGDSARQIALWMQENTSLVSNDRAQGWMDAAAAMQA